MNYCFGSLVLGKPYRKRAKHLACDLKEFAPGVELFVYTDVPSDFKGFDNVRAFKHSQQGTWLCWNDKRFVVKKALEEYPHVVMVDADSRIKKSLQKMIQAEEPLSACHEGLLEHLQKFFPEYVELFKQLALKMDVDLGRAKWIGESIYVVSVDGGNEKEFVEVWGKMVEFLELNGFHAGDGNPMGLAAEKVGWKIGSDAYNAVSDWPEHEDFGRNRSFGVFSDIKRRLGYHYRINRLRLRALKDYKFFYSK